MIIPNIKAITNIKLNYPNGCNHIIFHISPREMSHYVENLNQELVIDNFD